MPIIHINHRSQPTNTIVICPSHRSYFLRLSPKRGVWLEEDGKDCASQAEADNGLHHTSGTGRRCCGCAGRALGSSGRRCSWGCGSSLCDGTGTGCCYLDGSSSNGGVWDCRRNNHGARGDGGSRDLNRGYVDASWNRGSYGDNCWLGSNG